MNYKELAEVINSLTKESNFKSDFFVGTSYEEFRNNMLSYNYLQFKLETSANTALRGKDTSYQLDEYYTIDETANILKVSPQTIRNYIEGNLIPAINFSTDVKYNTQCKNTEVAAKKSKRDANF